MKLSAVTQARVMAFIETSDLSPKGRVFFPDLAIAIVERFRFQKFPLKAEDFDEQKGVTFEQGLWEGIVVQKLAIFWNGILLDTESSTAESERILEQALLWASERFNIEYKPGQIRRKRYLSNLTFYSEKKLLNLHPALEALASHLLGKVSEITGHDLAYEATRLDVDFCRDERQMPIAPFTIQRRLDTPFEQNKYFSEAPLPTDVHLKLLEDFEARMS